MQQQSLSIPAAIVIAGALIAIGVYTSSGKKSNNAVPANQNQPETTEVKMNAVSDKDHILGNPDAKVIIVEYSDTECPFCKRFH